MPCFTPFQATFFFCHCFGLNQGYNLFFLLARYQELSREIALPYGAGTIAVLFKVEFSASITELGIQGARDTFHWMDKWMPEWMNDRQG